MCVCHICRFQRNVSDLNSFPTKHRLLLHKSRSAFSLWLCGWLRLFWTLGFNSLLFVCCLFVVLLLLCLMWASKQIKKTDALKKLAFVCLPVRLMIFPISPQMLLQQRNKHGKMSQIFWTNLTDYFTPALKKMSFFSVPPSLFSLWFAFQKKELSHCTAPLFLPCSLLPAPSHFNCQPPDMTADYAFESARKHLHPWHAN